MIGWEFPSQKIFTFFGFFGGTLKKWHFLWPFCTTCPLQTAQGLVAWGVWPQKEADPPTLGIHLWKFATFVVSPKSGQFPFKDLKSKPKLKKKCHPGIFCMIRKKNHLTDLASPAMALCRAPYMMLVQPMSGVSILSHCLKSSTFNHLKLSTIWVAKNPVFWVSTWRLRKTCLQFVYIELHVSESVVPRMVRFHLYPTSVQSFSTRATFGPGIVTYLENLKYLVNPQKCDDRVDHKQTKTTPSKHIFPIGQLQRRRLPRLPHLPYMPYIPYLTYLAYIARPQTYHTLHCSTVHYITLHDTQPSVLTKPVRDVWFKHWASETVGLQWLQ